MPAKRRVRGVLSGVAAIADQAMVAAFGLIPSLLVARWSSQTDFGLFATSYSVYLFALVIHTALITEPMMVFGAGRFRDGFAAYLRRLLAFNLILSAFLGIVVAGAGILLSTLGSPLGRPLIFLAISLPALLLPYFVRRAAYSRFRVPVATLASALAAVIAVIALILLRDAVRANPGVAFLALAIAGTVTVSVWPLLLHSSATESRSISGQEVLLHHWSYGKWALGASAVRWIPGNFLYVFLPIVSGFQAAATLRALMNLVAPALRALSALSTVILPYFVRERERSEVRYHRMLVTSVAFVALTLPFFWLALGLFGEPVIRFLYDGKYVEASTYLWALGAIPIAMGIGSLFQAALRAEERPKDIFLHQLVAITISLPLAIAVVEIWEGAVSFAILMGFNATSLIVAYRCSRRNRRLQVGSMRDLSKG